MSALATGGTEVEIEISGAIWVVHTFTSSGTFQVLTSINTLEYLIVAGGGGGAGRHHGGGGGAGGLLTNIGGTPISLSANSYPITVGAGGNGGIDGTTPTNGQNSVLNTFTAIGGGGGGSYYFNGATGGSGGGAGYSYAPGAGTSGQGFAGGEDSLSANAYGAGGGGGAAEAGAAGSSTLGGNGGAGLQINITGTSTYYAGGGGGSAYTGTPGSGGSGGGGTGGAANNSPYSPTAGTPNTGGGGGGCEESGTATGGAGGSGIVIIRYFLCSLSTLVHQFTVDELNKQLNFANQFAIPVGSGTKPSIVHWPRNLEQEAIGIVTIPFRKGDLN